MVRLWVKEGKDSGALETGAGRGSGLGDGVAVLLVGEEGSSKRIGDWEEDCIGVESIGE
jgi:hypothetical protein